MQESIEEIKSISNAFQDYLESKIEGVKLEIIEESIDASSTIIGGFILGALFFISSVLLVTLAIIVLALVFDSYLISVGVILAFFLILTIVLYVFRKKLLTDRFRNKMYENYLSKRSQKK